MIKIRRSDERGPADHGWLKSMHTFSFADYYDPSQMGYSVLRVINEDRIDGGTGFGEHGHRDMEIISYVIDGALEHRDSMGTESVILPGEVQRMSAGTGVRHSEFNKLPGQPTHFLQIWIQPEQQGIKPGYAQKSFAKELEEGKLTLVVSKSGRNSSLNIAQDVDLYACKSNLSGETQFQIREKRRLWIQVIKGKVQVDQNAFSDGDGAAIEQVKNIDLSWEQGSEFLVFDLP